jgi:hypothetical protein
VHQIHELGMGFLPNWERGASYLVTASHAQALAAGNEAVAALRALGVPDDGSIACPFSWDVNVAPSQYAHCGAVADGIIEALAGRYRFTAYGQGGLIDYFARTGRLQSEGWLSASSSFPGYDAASPRVALVQRVGSPRTRHRSGHRHRPGQRPRLVAGWQSRTQQEAPCQLMDVDVNARLDRANALKCACCRLGESSSASVDLGESDLCGHVVSAHLLSSGTSRRSRARWTRRSWPRRSRPRCRPARASTRRSSRQPSSRASAQCSPMRPRREPLALVLGVRDRRADRRP